MELKSSVFVIFDKFKRFEKAGKLVSKGTVEFPWVEVRGIEPLS